MLRRSMRSIESWRQPFDQPRHPTACRASRPRPIFWQFSSPDITMERGEWPVAYRIHMAVFDRIEVDVVNVTPQINVVTNRMFPVASLPDAPLTARTPDRRAIFRFRHAATEIRLDAAPPRRVIGIAFGQAPDAMQMLGQDHPCDHGKRPTRPLQRNAVSQAVEVCRQQVVVAPLQQVHGEEPCTAMRPVGSVVWHAEKHARATASNTSADTPHHRQKTPTSDDACVGRDHRR
jgi:hypothetical protein